METNITEIEMVEPKARAIATQPNPAYLLQLAVEQGADLDRLERLMALQERWTAAEAKKAYDTAFADFKSEAVRIVKNKQVTDGPLKGKGYAELFAVVNAITPALSKHGLSSSWKLTKDERDWIEVTCTLKHSAGHTESVSMGGPPDTGGAKNAIQARASTVSYLERYTLKAITGLSEQNDDDDGGSRGLQDEWIEKANAAKSSTELTKISREGSAAFTKSKDVPGYQRFAKAVQTAGAELRKQESSNA